MISSSATAGITSLTLVLYVLLRRFIRPSLSMIRGPESPSFVFGHLLELFQRPVGEAEFAWQSLYGNIVRFKGVFGEERLLVSDPKALQKMLHTSAHTYPKPPNLRAILRLVNGQGILSADGPSHKRQRDVLIAGLGAKDPKELFLVFKECAVSLGAKLSETIRNSNGQTVVLDAHACILRATLDALVQAAADVKLGTIQDESHALVKKYKNLFGDVFGLPSASQVFVQAASIYVPTFILNWIADFGLHPRIARARDVKNTVADIVKQIAQEKISALSQGKGNRDIATLLIKANVDATDQMSNEELVAQFCTVLITAHTMITNSFSWIVLEVARNPKVQFKLRDEIRATEATIEARGDGQLTVEDLAAMPYLNAVIKEGLRFHPVLPVIQRMASRDDVLPLSKPIRTKLGGMTNEILVPRGTQIVLSAAAYNRDKDIWGEDAHEFNPDRWLNGTIDTKKSAGIGLYSHLMTFLSGSRACLGWRVALLGMQTFLFALIGNFEFGITDEAKRIIRQPMLVMGPAVESELDRGVQVPLTASLAPRVSDRG